MKLVTALCSLALFGAVSLQAADEPKKPAAEKPKVNPEDRFKEADTNKDGSLSKEEYAAAFGKKDAAKAEERFKALDKNADGKLSVEEFKARPEKKKEAK